MLWRSVGKTRIRIIQMLFQGAELSGAVWGGRVSLLGTPWVCQGEGTAGSVQAHRKRSVCCEWVSGDSWLQGEVIRMFSQGWLLALWFFHHL